MVLTCKNQFNTVVRRCGTWDEHCRGMFGRVCCSGLRPFTQGSTKATWAQKKPEGAKGIETANLYAWEEEGKQLET